MPEVERRIWHDTFIQPRDRLSDRQCAALGRIASTWSVVEYQMERILVRLALAPSLLGYVVTDRLGPDNRIEAIKGLINAHRVKYDCKLVSEKALSEIEALLPTLKLMKADRNFAVHSVWSRTGADYFSLFDITASAKSGLDMASGGLERTEDVEAFATSVQEMSDRLWAVSKPLQRLDSALLDRLRTLEQPGHRPQSARSSHQFPRRSWTQLPKDAPQPKPQKRRRR